jgi:hypothetical protein
MGLQGQAKVGLRIGSARTCRHCEAEHDIQMLQIFTCYRDVAIH